MSDILTYSQSRDQFTWHGKKFGHAPTTYSGWKKYHNDPNAEKIKDKGPIPRGKYHLEQYKRLDGKLGPYVIPLKPFTGTKTFGRSGFYIHGDNSKQNETGSEGCIVTLREYRLMFIREKIKELEVVK
jgi:hypothetical protein